MEKEGNEVGLRSEAATEESTAATPPLRSARKYNVNKGVTNDVQR